MRIMYWACFIVLIQASIVHSQSSLVLQTRFPDYSSEATGEYLIHPYDVVKIKDAIVVSDFRDNSIKEFNADGTLIKVIATEGSGPGEVIRPYAMAFDKKNNKLCCADQGNHRFVIFSIDGQYLRSTRHSASRLRDLAAYNDKIYAVSFNRQDKTLLSEYTGDGQFIKNFGDLWDHRVNKLKYRNLLYGDTELTVYQDSLYVFFKSLPIINVYCLQDYSFRQIDVKANFAQNILKNNLHPKKVMKKDALKIKTWLRGAVIDDDKIYCFALWERKMVVLDRNGNLLETIGFVEKETIDDYSGRWFRCKKGDQFIFTDMTEGQILIYKLEQRGEH